MCEFTSSALPPPLQNSYVTSVPKGTEAGTVWAIDIGGSNIRVLECVLHGAGKISSASEYKTVIPQSCMTGAFS